MKPSVCLVGHGSRDPEGTREFMKLVEMFQSHDPSRIVECGFLEFAQPVIQDGFDRCIERGARTVVVLPATLMAAGHTKNDIPSEIHEARVRHPERHVPLRAALCTCTRKSSNFPPSASKKPKPPPKTRVPKQSIVKTRYCSSWAVAAAIPTPTPTSKSSPVFCGSASASAGPRPVTAASPRRSSPKRYNVANAWVTLESSFFRSSCLRAFWKSASAKTRNFSPPNIRKPNSFRPTIWTAIRSYSTRFWNVPKKRSTAAPT